MLSNSSKYAVNAVLYLAVHSSVDNKIGVKEIAEVLQIPSPFLAKLLQILVRKKAISSTKGPKGGFYLTDEERDVPLVQIVYHIDGIDRFTNCSLGLKKCSAEKPCPLHHTIEPFKRKYLEELENNTIKNFADKVKNGTVYLFV